MLPGLILGVAVLTALLAYALACRLTGENLVATWWDEWRLRREDLRCLDTVCAASPRASDLVVSLTTIPSRLDAIVPTLKSLLRQTMRPREIRLCLPEWSVRESRPYLVPAWLSGLRSISIVRCADEGPATKFLSTLRAVSPDQPVLIVDDDRIYHRRLLEAYAPLVEAHPDEVVAASGWDVPADLIDRPTTLWRRLRRAPYVPVRANQLRRPREVDVVQGVHSYVVRPRFFDLAALGGMEAVPAAVRRVDDVWISAHCAVPRRVRPMRLGYTDYLPWQHRRRHLSTSLGRLNRARDDAQRANSEALRFLQAHWRHRR